MKYSSCKEIECEVKRLVRTGWMFNWSGKHGKLTPPGKKIFLTVPSSPSDSKSFKNFLSDVRRVERK
jgi:hypothetical protein